MALRRPPPTDRPRRAPFWSLRQSQTHFSQERVTFPPTILRIHVPAKPAAHRTQQESLRQEESPLFISVGSRARSASRQRLLPFPASCSSGIRPPTAEDSLCGCIGSRRPPAALGAAGSQSAFQCGPRGDGRSTQATAKRPRDSIARSPDKRDARARAWSRSPQYLIHKKVGNTTPSSAVSSV